VKLADIPGFSRNLARVDRLENYWRDFAFLGINEEIRVAKVRFPVQLLTLRMFVQLVAVRSPFMIGGMVRPEHVLQMLWRLSPEYDATNKSARMLIAEKLVTLPFRESVRAVSRFLDRMLIDKPPCDVSAAVIRPDVSLATTLVHSFASSYGWSAETILDTPMPVLFQFIRKIAREADPELSHFNPLRDRFTQRIVQRHLATRAGS
jgi:hypothetical protein